MPTLWDKETNAPVEVPDKDVLGALEGGRYAIRDWDVDGQRRVQVVAPTGEVAPVPIEKLTTAIAMGGRIETEEDRERRELRKRETDRANPITAAVTGFGDIASFGVLPQAMEAIGGEDYREQRKALEEAQPLATTIGRVAGAMVPGAGIGRAVGTAATGALAARGVGAIGQAAGGLAAAGAAEGAIVGGAELLSEDALGRADVLSQDLLSYVGGGALLGGAVGGALGLTGGALKKATQKIIGDAPKAEAARAQTLEAIAQDAEESAGWLRTQASDLAASLQGKDAVDIKKFLDPGTNGRAVRQAAQEGASKRFRDRVAFKMADLLNDGNRQFNTVADEAMGELKVENIRKVIDPANANEAASEAYDIIKQIRGTIGRITDPDNRDLYVQTNSLRFAKAGKKYFDAVVPRLEELGQRIETGQATVDDATELFILMDRTKRKVGSWTRAGKSVTGNDAAGIKMFQESYDRIRDHLERVDLFGNAAVSQKAINAQWVKLLDSEHFFRRKFVERFGQEGWSPHFEVDPGAMVSYLAKADGPEGALARKALDKHIEGQLGLADAIERTFPLSDEVQVVARELRATGSKLKTVMGDSYKKIELANELADLTANARFLNIGKGIRLGAAIEELGVKATRAAGFGKVQEATTKADSKLTAAVRRMAERKPTKRTALAPVGVGVFFESPLRPKGHKKEKSMRSAYEARADELSSLMADPQGMADRVAANSTELEMATPKLARAMAAKTAETVTYLYGKLPKRPPQPTLTPLAQDWAPSMAEVSKFARTYTAAMDPLSVLDDLERGTITREAVDAIRQLYPDLHQKMLTKIQEQVGSRTEPLDYTDRVQLSILFGTPLDPSMQPERIAQYQQSVQGQAPNPQPPTGMPPTPQPTPGQAGGGIRVQGLQKVTLGKSMQTRTQQIEEAQA
jgi:hypothetical protein